uniref:Dehydrogenase n=2 Tax=Lutzomyia longipalpis TaxID=7200 RepID=A0A1B0CSZ2_LUTLO
MGVINCTREAVASMRDRDVAGQVIHINSLLGHKVTMPPSGANSNLNVYPATKFAISALTESYQFEMVAENRKIKFSSVSPGVVATEFFDETTLKSLQHFPHLLPSDISQAVLYILSTPPHVNIQDVLIKPLGSSKFGVTALTEILRQEMSKDELPIKISSISPDVVQTNLTEMFSKDNLAKTPHLLSSDISQAVVYVLSTPPHELLKVKDSEGAHLAIKVTSISPAVVQTDITQAYSKEALANFPHLKAEDISAAVLYTLGTPPHVNIQEILIKPVGSFI